MRRFANFACIDWSGESVARPKGIAVARCDAGDGAPILLRPGRGWSRETIVERLVHQADVGADVLIGIDFSPALPFVDRDGYFPEWPESPSDARALWLFIDTTCASDQHLSANSFVDHPDASRHYRRHDHKRGLRQGDLFGSGRLRQTEIACRDARHGMAQSCFNLVGAAQVGKSSLTGMRVLHRLAGRIPVWPFDPVPAHGPLIVEIYTTIAARAASVRGGSKLRSWEALDAALRTIGSRPIGRTGTIDDHSSDAILTAAWLRHVAADEMLWRPAALTPTLAATEGWTFGVP